MCEQGASSDGMTPFGQAGSFACTSADCFAGMSCMWVRCRVLQ